MNEILKKEKTCNAITAVSKHNVFHAHFTSVVNTNLPVDLRLDLRDQEGLVPGHLGTLHQLLLETPPHLLGLVHQTLAVGEVKVKLGTFRQRLLILLAVHPVRLGAPEWSVDL